MRWYNKKTRRLFEALDSVNNINVTLFALKARQLLRLTLLLPTRDRFIDKESEGATAH